MATIFYFTESYPYGIGEDWKTNELKVLCKNFDRIIILPLNYGNNKVSLALPGTNIKVLPPVFGENESGLRFSDLRLIFSLLFIKNIWNERGLIINHKRFLKALFFFKQVELIKKSEAFLRLISESTEGDIWYFFWSRGWADMLPFIETTKGIKKYARLHGYDLYLERNQGYIPFRKSFFNAVDFLLPISESGKRYLLKNFEIDPEKLHVARLGTLSIGRSRFSQDGIFRIASCSSMIAVKRIDRIIEALSVINESKIEWVHIGDGILRKELQQLTNKLESNIRVNFMGKLAPSQVLEFYINHPVDLFINTSEFEGVPVSIMEALSAGIPVMAMDVGGVSEIVDTSLGILLNPESDSITIANELKKMIHLSIYERNKLSIEAVRRYENVCNAQICAQHLVTIFSK
jgi:glycosyltransferase involved in cell wall biosynthesis